MGSGDEVHPIIKPLLRQKAQDLILSDLEAYRSGELEQPESAEERNHRRVAY